MKTRSEYHGFCNWDRTPEGEARVFAEFWEHIQGMRAYARSRHYGYRVYHYTHHEVSSFRELARRHKGYPGVPTMEELNELMDSKEFVDLYPILSQQLIWPTESVTLKDVAKWIRFSWRDTDPGGGNSLAWFADAVGDGPEAKENQQRLLEYNDDDCHAQAAIRDWLTMLGESRAPGKKLPRVEELDKRFNK
jgi:predicted RecB family nuclease